MQASGELAESIFPPASREGPSDSGRALGLYRKGEANFLSDRGLIREYINMKLQALGFDALQGLESAVVATSFSRTDAPGSRPGEEVLPGQGGEPYTPGSSVLGSSDQPAPACTISMLAKDLLTSLRSASVALQQHLCPPDSRIQHFINEQMAPLCLPKELSAAIRLPSQMRCFNLDRYGVAFELCTPFDSSYVKAHGTEAVRVPQGLLCNPENDKRTTAGTFHVAESGAAIPADKIAVPKRTFALLLREALNPPEALLELPFTANLPEQARCRCWTSVYLTPVVCPGVNERFPQKHMEVRFFAPGAYVSNVAFVESIFGNAGDPNLPQNDLWLRPMNNAGVTGCIIIAPHLRKLTKKALGLPHVNDATARQKRDGMCYSEENELYNGGKPFKAVYRTYEGTYISLIADTYYGYSKKEIKSMISYAANIRGLAEEEHSGGCIAIPAYNWGRQFKASDKRVGLSRGVHTVGSEFFSLQALGAGALPPDLAETGPRVLDLDSVDVGVGRVLDLETDLPISIRPLIPEAKQLDSLAPADPVPLVPSADSALDIPKAKSTDLLTSLRHSSGMLDSFEPVREELDGSSNNFQMMLNLLAPSAQLSSSNLLVMAGGDGGFGGSAGLGSARRPHVIRAVAKYDKLRGILVDKQYPGSIFYVPETTSVDLSTRTISWNHPETGAPVSETIYANKYYILPNGYRVQLIRHPVSKTWMLQGMAASRHTHFHKPFTVSGGGKSEISKSVLGSVTSGPFFVQDFEKMCRQVDEILDYDYSKRFKAGEAAGSAEVGEKPAEKPTGAVDVSTPSAPADAKEAQKFRHILSFDRTLGSVIKLLTPDDEKFTPEYNGWLRGLDRDAVSFVFVLKALYRQSWGPRGEWRSQFRVDRLNGAPGHAIVCQGQPLIVNYLRVGMERDEKGNWNWRNYRLRNDYYPSVKLQTQDDITASVTLRVPEVNYDRPERSYKLVTNVEHRFFQRPDDCVVPGADLKCELDLSRCEGGTFISNFEPVSRELCRRLADDTMSLEKYSEPEQRLIRDFAAGASPGEEFVVVSNLPRITGYVDGAPRRSANVRYLQDRTEWSEPARCERHMAEICQRLAHSVPLDQPVYVPVDLYLPGRRLNPASQGRPLAVYGPIHYQEIPELFLDLIPSLSGKSPSTTGAGCEGALTKGPFNSLLPVIDLNNALLSLILTGVPQFSTAAGYIGEELRVDHDISLIVPEVLARMSERERSPSRLISEGCLEKIEDFEYEGETIPASLLGYRITHKFVVTYFARVFDSVETIFEEKHLRPEKQSMADFVAGIKHIHEKQLQVVRQYFEDGSVHEAVPPLKYLLHIVRDGSYKGLTLQSPDFRAMFERDNVLASSWYQRRLLQQQRADVRLNDRFMRYVNEFMRDEGRVHEATRTGMNFDNLVASMERRQQYLASSQYVHDLEGSIGLHVFGGDEIE